MKIYAISDLHISTSNQKPMDIFGGNWVGYIDKIRENWLSKVSNDDIVLLSGDLSWAMHVDEAEKDIVSLSDLPGKKVIIRGNHDYWWSSISKVRDILPFKWYALQNDSIRFDNIIICGSRGWSVPGSPDFDERDEKLYKRETERFRLSIKDASKTRKEGDKLIVMIHYPPFNVRRENSAFTDLFEENNVDVVVYGHLHGKDVRADKVVTKNGIKYYLTSCDLVDNVLQEICL